MWIPQRSTMISFSWPVATSLTSAPALAVNPRASDSGPSVPCRTHRRRLQPNSLSWPPFGHRKVTHCWHMLNMQPLFLPCLHAWLQPVFHFQTTFRRAPACTPKSTHQAFWMAALQPLSPAWSEREAPHILLVLGAGVHSPHRRFTKDTPSLGFLNTNSSYPQSAYWALQPCKQLDKCLQIFFHPSKYFYEHIINQTLLSYKHKSLKFFISSFSWALPLLWRVLYPHSFTFLTPSILNCFSVSVAPEALSKEVYRQKLGRTSEFTEFNWLD